MICQNMEWLAWPPPLLRTAVRIFSGTRFNLGQQLFDGELLQICMSFERLVQICDIGAVVFIVMNFHCLLVNVRLKSVCWIW